MSRSTAQAWISHPTTTPPRGRVIVPGDRRMTEPAMILAGIALGESRIVSAWPGVHTDHLGAVMRALGATAERQDDGSWIMAGRGVGGLTEPRTALRVTTAARLLCGLLATHPFFSVIAADPPTNHIAMPSLLADLRTTGARLTARGDAFLPVAIEGAHRPLPLDLRRPSRDHRMSAPLLFSGLNVRGETRIAEPGGTTSGWTEALLRHMGAVVRHDTDDTGRFIALPGQPDLRGGAMTMPGNLDLAEVLVVAAVVVPGSSVTLTGVDLTRVQHGLIPILTRMGAPISIETRPPSWSPSIGDITIDHAPLHAIEVSLDSLLGNESLFAVAAACASGTTRLLGGATAWAHDIIDRVCAAAGGVSVTADGDDLLIRGAGGAPPGGGRMAVDGDAYLSIAGLVLGMASARVVTVDDGKLSEHAFPAFRRVVNDLGAQIEPA